jgi:hypothetical protein
MRLAPLRRRKPYAIVRKREPVTEEEHGNSP